MAHAIRALSTTPIRSASKSSMQKAGSVAKSPVSSIPHDYREARRIINPPPASEEKLSLPRFLANYHEHFPVSVRVCKGFCGMNEEKSISEGDCFNVHFVKYTTVVSVEFENGSRSNVPLNSAVPFALLYDPHSNHTEALKGYRFEKVGDMLQTSKLPLVVRARKAYQSSNADNSIVANELLYLKKPKKAKMLGKQHLKVYSLTAGREKSLSESCIGNFSTKPKDICLFLPEILKNMPDIFPCRAVLFNNPHSEAASSMPSSNKVMSLVTMMHSSIETSLVATSALEEGAENARMLDLPIELDILVRVIPTTERQTQQLYEDTSYLYKNFNPAKLHPYVNSHANSGVIERQAQLYTNVKPDCSGVDLTKPALLIEEGHYQAPRATRTPSDPVPIESVYHPPESSSPPQGASNSPPQSYSKFYRSLSTPNTAGVKVAPPNQLPLSGSTVPGPPLPPRHPRKRTPGYCYIEMHPRTTRPVLSEFSQRSAGNSQCAHPSSSSTPDSAHSDSSFGSTGSGGAVVEQRRNSSTAAAASFVHSTRVPLRGGSGDGIVEGILRNRSASPVDRSSAATVNSTNTSSDSIDRTSVCPDSGNSRGVKRAPASTHERSSSLGSIRPDSMIFNSVLDDLDQLKQQLDDLVIQHSEEDRSSGTNANFKKAGSPASFSTGSSSETHGSYESSLEAETAGSTEPPTAVSKEVIEANRKHLATMDTFQVRGWHVWLMCALCSVIGW